MNNPYQPELFDLGDIFIQSCSNCDFGEWHQRDIDYQNKNLKVLYPCKRCFKCENNSKWIQKRKEVIVEEKEEWIKQMEQEEIEKTIVPVVIQQQELFDDAIDKENAKVLKNKHVQKNLEARKKLALTYYENPKNDNELLFNYQHDFLKNNDMKAYAKLLELAFIVTKRLVWKWMKKNKTPLDEIEQDEKTSIAVEYVMRRYQKNIGYCITTNFITALNDGVIHAMKYRTKADYVTESLQELEEKGIRL